MFRLDPWLAFLLNSTPGSVSSYICSFSSTLLPPPGFYCMSMHVFNIYIYTVFFFLLCALTNVHADATVRVDQYWNKTFSLVKRKFFFSLLVPCCFLFSLWPLILSFNMRFLKRTRSKCKEVNKNPRVSGMRWMTLKDKKKRPSRGWHWSS